MPKRKAQKPANKAEPKKRGRPPKAKPKKIGFINGGPVEYEPFMLDSRGFASLLTLPELSSRRFSLSNKEIPPLGKLLEIIESDRKAVWDNRDLSTAGDWQASMYAFRVKQFLSFLQEHTKQVDDNSREIVALAIELGRLSIAMQVADKGRAYEIRSKRRKSSELAAKQKQAKRPASEVLMSFLKDDIARHGKKTLAIANAAKKWKVKSTKTIRNWMDRYKIELG